MSTNPTGLALSLLHRFAQSELADKTGIRGPAETLAYRSTRLGFQAASKAGQQWRRLQGRSTDGQRLALPGQTQQRFDLNLSEEQQMLVDSLQRLAREHIRPQARAMDDQCQAPSELLQAVHELGLTHMVVAENLGGAAEQRSPVSMALAAEQLAWGDMGAALAMLAPAAVATVLGQYGSNLQQQQYLPMLLGEHYQAASLAVMEPQVLFDPFQLQTQAKSIAGGYELSGCKSMVVMGAQASFWLVAADLPGEGPQLFVVEAEQPGITVQAEPTMGLRSAALAKVQLDCVAVPAEARIDGLDYQQVIDLSRIAWCALALGAGQAVLDYVTTYANERQAFGAPISHRQAVAFLIANIAVELQGLRLLTWRAASRAEHGLSFQREAYLAQVFCSDKAMQIGTDGVQLLGGHGFVKEHPVELWYRHLRSPAVAIGAIVV